MAPNFGLFGDAIEPGGCKGALALFVDCHLSFGISDLKE
jgi:hypothetical protein